MTSVGLCGSNRFIEAMTARPKDKTIPRVYLRLAEEESADLLENQHISEFDADREKSVDHSPIRSIDHPFGSSHSTVNKDHLESMFVLF
jgi:hypothetical protein